MNDFAVTKDLHLFIGTTPVARDESAKSVCFCRHIPSPIRNARYRFFNHDQLDHPPEKVWYKGGKGSKIYSTVRSARALLINHPCPAALPRPSPPCRSDEAWCFPCFEELGETAFTRLVVLHAEPSAKQFVAQPDPVGLDDIGLAVICDLLNSVLPE